MAVTTFEELFQFSLECALDMERRLVPILGDLANEVNDPEFRALLLEHQQQTRHHVQNVEECLRKLQVQPTTMNAAAIAGLQQEHDSFAQQHPPVTILTAFDVGAGEKTEHLETGAYLALIELAQSLGRTDCLPLLGENLSQEEWMARQVARIGQRLGQQMKSTGTYRAA
jgi:ferritin-like metal-binding protein YciE